MELGQLLRQARLDSGMSQRELCGDKISRNMLSQIENGTAHPSMETLAYLAEQLGKPIGYFLDEHTPSSPNHAIIDQARAAFTAGNYGLALSLLKQYQIDDPVFDWEYHLLEAQSCLELATKAIQTGHTAQQHIGRAQNHKLGTLGQQNLFFLFQQTDAHHHHGTDKGQYIGQ